MVERRVVEPPAVPRERLTLQAEFVARVENELRSIDRDRAVLAVVRDAESEYRRPGPVRRAWEPFDHLVPEPVDDGLGRAGDDELVDVFGVD